MKRKMTGLQMFCLFLLIGLPVLMPTWGWCQGDLEFYKGKMVTWIVTTKAGGGFDAYARMIAPYLQKYLPGSTVIVKNVPGAGHIIGLNELYAAKPDGLTIGTYAQGLHFQQLAGIKAVRFDLSKLTYLGNASTTQGVFIVGTKTPFKTFDDIVKNSSKVVMSSSGVGSPPHNNVLMVNKIFGLNIKLVPGYGGADADLAMIRGEITGQCGLADTMDPLIERGEARGLLVYGGKSLDPKKYPDAKYLPDIAPKKMESLVNLMMASSSLARPISAPPGLPAGRAKVLREAVWKAMNDPELRKVADKMKMYLGPMTAEETERLAKLALNQPPDVIELVKEMAKTED